jgi:hypothetical protein
MSHVSHPRIPLTEQVRAHRTVALAGLLALAATVAVVLIIAIGGDSTDSQEPVVQPAQQTLRPDESAVAGARTPAPAPSPRPDESSVAGSIDRSQPVPSLGVRSDGGPEEGRAAQSIGGSGR